MSTAWTLRADFAANLHTSGPRACHHFRVECGCSGVDTVVLSLERECGYLLVQCTVGIRYEVWGVVLLLFIDLRLLLRIVY
jgi:hypothetical protein